MIERRVIDGRPAIICYMNADYGVVGIERATQAKVAFEDGEVMWLTVEESESGEVEIESVEDFLSRMEAYWPGA